jgi:cell division protein FtsB
MLHQRTRKLITVLKNKYTITIIAMVAWLLFFDRYDFITQYKTVKELKKLEEEKQYYVVEIARNEQDLHELSQNPEYLERFAREKYLMKRPGEDVFIISDSRTSANSPKE